MTSWQSVLRDVRGQLRAPAGGVDPDDDGAGQGRAGQEEDVLGRVLEEDPDVERAVTTQLAEKIGRAARASATTWRHDHSSDSNSRPRLSSSARSQDELGRGGDRRLRSSDPLLEEVEEGIVIDGQQQGLSCHPGAGTRSGS